jgi:hypothetical protein
MDNLEKPFATGRTAEIYAYSDGKILKLFFSTVPQSWSDREAGIGQYIQEAELPVPKVFERVKIKIGMAWYTENQWPFSSESVGTNTMEGGPIRPSPGKLACSSP